MKIIFSSITIFCLLFSHCVIASDVTLRDKIGQMLIFGFNGKQVDDNSPIVEAIKTQNIGGVVLFDYDYQSQQYDKNIESPNQVKELNQSLQQAAHEGNTSHNRPDLPLIISVDYEGGKVNRLKHDYGFPDTKSAAAVGEGSLREAEKNAAVMADTMLETGFNLDFAPVLDVDVNSDNPIIGQVERSFSSDPLQVANFSAIYARAFQKKHIQCAYKHFPGHGSSTSDSHLGFVDVTTTWSTDELLPYVFTFNNKNTQCGMVMTAHIVNRNLDQSGLPATLSQNILTGILRDQLKFDGVIITDDMQMKAISEHFTLKESVTLAINAGADMLIFGNQLAKIPQDPKQLIDIIERQVKTGAISEYRIDGAYKRIIELKQTLSS